MSLAVSELLDIKLSLGVEGVGRGLEYQDVFPAANANIRKVCLQQVWRSCVPWAPGIPVKSEIVARV